ncbi:MAG: hypothetical protein OXG05_06265 [Gammaproteobacteria bacterium]|nr:hypothetical protein [Gammaproteobacteria bacterium]
MAQSNIEDEIAKDVNRLISFLRTRSNRDKLPDKDFEIATSLITQWEWNYKKITGVELRQFRTRVKTLVDQIKT